jgi:hypothetical protein
MIFIRNWNSTNVMKIAQGGYDYGQEAQLFDLNLDQWITTPTPTPQ